MNESAPSSLARLLAISSSGIVKGELRGLQSGIARTLGARGDELLSLLQRKNGFYAFESALHVYAAHATSDTIDLARWNESRGWKRAYGAAARGCVFFAQDIFAHQFCIHADAVWRFDPESGAKEKLSDDLEGWAQKILQDYEYLTGHPIAHEWQAVHGALPEGVRLAPTTPFMLGGKFSIDNLFAADALQCVKYYSDIYRKTRHLSDGSVVRLRTKP